MQTPKIRPLRRERRYISAISSPSVCRECHVKFVRCNCKIRRGKFHTKRLPAVNQQPRSNVGDSTRGWYSRKSRAFNVFWPLSRSPVGPSPRSPFLLMSSDFSSMKHRQHQVCIGTRLMACTKVYSLLMRRQCPRCPVPGTMRLQFQCSEIWLTANTLVKLASVQRVQARRFSMTKPSSRQAIPVRVHGTAHIGHAPISGFLTLVYSDSCISVTLVEEWPAGGGTWTMIDCMRAMGLSEPVSTLYFNAPTDLKTSGETV